MPLAIGPIFSLVFGGIGSFLKAALTFFTTKPGVYILMVLAVLGAFWFVNDKAYDRGVAATVAANNLRQAEAVAAADQHARIQQAELDQGDAYDAYKLGLAQGKAQAQTVTLTREVPIYVTPATDARFPVPCGLYRVLRARAASDDTDPSTVDLPDGLGNEDACPITASDIARLGVQWAGLYHGLAAQVIDLQDKLVRTITVLTGKAPQIIPDAPSEGSGQAASSTALPKEAAP